MSGWSGFVLVVFITTFLANVMVVAVWPDSEVDWIASAVVAAVTAGVLALVYGRRSDLSR